MEVINLCQMEISFIEILSKMKDNIYNHYKEKSIINIDKSYIIQRKSLISLIRKISNKMSFKSQTFFLAINYLDVIFSKNKNIFYNCNLLAVGCLIIASKFCENVPLKPIFYNFVILYNNEISDENKKITKDDLFKYEIIICKLLNYKLNYFTIYDFNFFFFGNGIIKKAQLKDNNYDISRFYKEIKKAETNDNGSSPIKRLLIKIYERSRHYLDIIIENLICLKFNSLLISICIMEKSIDYTLINYYNLNNNDASFDIEKIRLNNKLYFQNIMKEYYNIDLEQLPKYQDLKIECENYKLFEDIYDIKYNKIINYSKLRNNKTTENDSSSKNINIKKDISFEHSPYIKKKEIKEKDKLNLLYRKANIQILSKKNNNNMSIIRKKKSPLKRMASPRDNKFHFNEKLNKNINE